MSPPAPTDTPTKPYTSSERPSSWSTREHQVQEEEEEDDEDPGMFSFARPTTGDQYPNVPSSDGPLHSSHQGARSSTFDSNTEQFSFARPPSQVWRNPAAQVLSPAAAYALANHSSNAGPRKRSSFSTRDSPSQSLEDPYQHYLRTDEETRRSSESSSRDKIEAADSSWADQQDFAYALTPEGQAIMLNEMGEPIRLATTREQKMLAGLGVESYVPYRPEPEYEEEEDSPYPEVRASVSNIDDPEMPVLTVRAWFIGLLFCIVISALNCFFNLRYPAPLITPILTQILSYPLGKLLARYLPITTWRLPRWARRIGFSEEFSLNSGPFNIKEHTIIVMMANISTSPAYGVTFSLASEKYYGIQHSAGFDILVILTSQMVGFGVAGLCRRFLVWPAAMIWPQNLVFCTLLNTLHAEDEDEGQGISRFNFFLYVFGAAFVWYWLPGFLFTALSAFSWVCWIAPNNVVVNQLFGISSGLGMGLFTFDWSQIAYLSSPLVVPWWAEVNVFCGFALAFWIIAPIMYYSNVWEAAFLPMSTSQVYDRFGAPYNTSLVVDPINLSLNKTAYHAYSPLYLPITYATVYGLAFMLATSVIVHTILYHGKNMLGQLKRLKVADEDVHVKLMKNYPEVPDWWYAIYTALAVGLSIVTVACFDTQMPVWALLVSLILAFVYVLPGGIVFALTSTQVSINLIVELVGGYIIPGRPLANMLFKLYGLQAVGTALTFVQDLKLGHYMKIPPRASFKGIPQAQIASTFVTAFVQVGVKRWLVSRVPDLCDERQAFLLTCPNARVFYSSSVIWGLVGPARQFGFGRLYNPILYWLLAGSVLPVITWCFARRYPRSAWQYVNVPVALSGAIYMPPATGINFSSWFLVGFIFQYLLRRRQFRWWSKFNFVLSAGLDSGTVISGIIIFLTLSLPKNGTISLQWWGNDVYTKTLDWAGVSYKTAPVEGFGRTSW
ncbi:hypothetical protein JCM16303_000244 [Sporobolomyces ruberrimus]